MKEKGRKLLRFDPPAFCPNLSNIRKEVCDKDK